MGNAAMMFAFLGAVWHANQAGDAAALMNQVSFFGGLLLPSPNFEA